jgi:DNA-binding NtrC family response regulator
MGKTRKIKVLVVDGEEEFASTLVSRLRLHKIASKGVFSGRNALKSIGSYRPDVIVLDMKIPDMSGFDVLSKVMVLDVGIEVIMFIGHDAFDAGITGIERGAFDFMFKPVDLVLLIEKITQAYKKRRGEKNHQVFHTP